MKRRRIAALIVGLCALGAVALPSLALSQLAEGEDAEAEISASTEDSVSSGAGSATISELGLDDDLGFDLDQLEIFDDLALLAAEDVVVSASRRRQRIEESPSAITVITREQIQAGGYDNLVDLMRLVPGADVYRITQGLGTVGLRSRSTWSGDRILVLVDGRDIAMHFLGLPQWMAMPFDIDSIERVEVIRGPGSTLYGANALQGVVNIVTRSPGEDPVTTEIVAGGSGLSTFAADAKVHGSIGSWSYWAGAGWDQRSPYALPEEVSFETLRARAFLDWRGESELNARLESGFIWMDGNSYSYMGEGPMRVLWPYLLGRVSWNRTEVLALLDWSDLSGEIDLGLRLPDDDQPLAEALTLHVPTRSAELTAHHTLDLFSGASLMLGGSARAIHHMPGALITCPDTIPADFDPADCVPTEVLETRLGLFAQSEITLRRHLALNLSGRVDLNSLTAQPGFSPRAALVYSSRPGHALRLAYGRAFRKPTFIETDLSMPLLPDPETPGDLGRRLQQLFSQIGNRDLVNEFVDSLEVGWRARFLDDRLSLVADVYGARFQHPLVGYVSNMELLPGFGGVPTISHEAVMSFRNGEHPVWSHGAELQLGGRPSPWLELSGYYAFDNVFQPKIDPDTGELFYTREAEWEAHHRLAGSARVTAGGLSLGMDLIWFSTYLTDTRDPYSVLAPEVVRTVGAVPLVNSQVGYRLPFGSRGSVELGLASLNLLDQPYREVGAHSEVDGRTIGGGEILKRRLRLFVRGQF